MTKFYDKNGNEIPNEDIATVVYQAVAEVKHKRNMELAQQIRSLANKRASNNEEFTLADAYMVISVVKNHDDTYPFNNT